MITNTSDKTFEQDTAKGVTVTDCWASWCGPCRMMAPVIEQLAKSYAGKIHFNKLNVDENHKVPMKFGIQGIPTLIVKKDGQVMDTIVGFRQADALKPMLDRYL